MTAESLQDKSNMIDFFLKRGLSGQEPSEACLFTCTEKVFELAAAYLGYPDGSYD